MVLSEICPRWGKRHPAHNASFPGADFKTNLERLDQLANLASDSDLTVAQLALAWVLAQGDHILVIPGTRFEDRAKENLDAANVSVSHDVISQAGRILSPDTIIGERWPEVILREVDSEKYRFAG